MPDRVCEQSVALTGPIITASRVSSNPSLLTCMSGRRVCTSIMIGELFEPPGLKRLTDAYHTCS